MCFPLSTEVQKGLVWPWHYPWKRHSLKAGRVDACCAFVFSPNRAVWKMMLNAMFFGQSVYEVVSEMCPTVGLGSFWGAMPSQGFIFKAQDGVLGSGTGHSMFQLPHGFFHHWKHMAHAVPGLWERDLVNLLASPCLYFNHHHPYQRGFDQAKRLITARVSYSWITCVIVSTI